MKIRHWLRAYGELEVLVEHTYYWRSGAHRIQQDPPEDELDPAAPVQPDSILDLMFGDLAGRPGSGVEKLADGIYLVDKDWR